MHIHHDHTSETSPFYWVLTAIIFLVAKVSGIIHLLAEELPGVTIPEHDIWYLPQLHELLPAVIIAFACATISWVVNKCLSLLYYTVFPNKK